MTPASRSFALLALSTALALGGCDCSKDTGPGDGGITDAHVDAGRDTGFTEPCGDSIRGITESCDDGNTAPGDGCSGLCQIEAGFRCPFVGALCIAIVCNDPSHLIEAPETCEDGNTTSSDGCSSTCQLEPGWACQLPGALCTAAMCGDGIVAGTEACDDHNTASSDGCSSTCQLEVGFYCPTAGTTCQATRCGDGVTQGLEQCDNDTVAQGQQPKPYDGCDRTCKWEPQCSNGTCTARCGDGVILPGSGEVCDDGNTRSGDGCSADCTAEPGYTCVVQALPTPGTVTLPSVLRDFRGSDLTSPAGHPDFQPTGASGLSGITQSTLNAQGRPQRAAGNPSPGNGSFPSSAASFLQWYTDDGDGVTGTTSRTIYTTLTLTRVGTTNTYRYPPSGTSGADYFPLDGLGFNQTGSVPFEARRTDHANVQRNFHFTTELHYWFEYAGNESLSFTGDDDLWVFVDGQLCLDIGGQHGAVTGTMDFNNLGSLPVACRSFVAGRVYEMAIFNAERHTTESNFELTLGNFVKRQSACTSMCGDGTRASNEVCDLGSANNMGGYGQCTSDCTMLGPHCGDGVVDANHEACDDGANNVGGYGHCTPACVSGGRCGDGIRQFAEEECDDGANNGQPSSRCLSTCNIALE